MKALTEEEIKKNIPELQQVMLTIQFCRSIVSVQYTRMSMYIIFKFIYHKKCMSVSRVNVENISLSSL